MVVYTSDEINRLTEEESYELYKKASHAEKLIDEDKKKLTAPLNKAIKEIRDRYRDIEETIGTIKLGAKSRIEYIKNSLSPAIDMTVGAMVAPIAKYRTKCSLRIVDVHLIPLEYMLPNTAKIEESIKSGSPVPGCELMYEKIVTL